MNALFSCILKFYASKKLFEFDVAREINATPIVQVTEMDSMLTSSVGERDEHIKNLESEKNALERNLSEAVTEQNALKATCSELESEFESARKEHELKLEGRFCEIHAAGLPISFK